jgi:hypothetical protein
MPYIEYQAIKIQGKSRILIDQVNQIIREYQAQGYALTLRQVYYQLVSRDIIENTEASYKRIGELVNTGRLAGLIDWEAIEDRTRNVRALPHWKTPGEIIQAAAEQYNRDLWEGQKYYVEVWVEKDALIGIVEPAAQRLDVPCFSCRGYTSQSEMWEASRRFIGQGNAGRECVIIHLGDHDPGGLDMTRDIEDRLSIFRAEVKVDRIALNMPQIKAYNPPPNPAKITDTRAAAYIEKHGKTSWELDALPPDALDRLITATIETYLDRKLYARAKERQNKERERIKRIEV